MSRKNERERRRRVRNAAYIAAVQAGHLAACGVDPKRVKELEGLVLDRVKMAATTTVSLRMVQDEDLKSLAGIVSDRLVFKLESQFMAYGQEELEFPDGWWQAVRERWLPRWWLTWWPVWTVNFRIFGAVVPGWRV